jgi:hypothetical protein
MELSFSQRMSLQPIKSFQIDSMDDDLRRTLWNDYYTNIFANNRSSGDFRTFMYKMWQMYFNESADQFSGSDEMQKHIVTTQVGLSRLIN